MTVIITILVLSGILAAGVYICQNTEFEGTGFTIGAVTSVVLLVVALIILGVLVSTPAEIEQFKQTKQTIEGSRTTSEIERATLTTQIIEANEWLASSKYYNRIFFFCDLIPDEVNELTPIK